jgi:bifunctional pyridoxal-dependent enzyme with beta-cystathionase and maltose regulon repressor activities
VNPFEVPDLRSRRSDKWTEHGPDVLPMWVAEMDVVLAGRGFARLNFGTSEELLREGVRRISLGVGPGTDASRRGDPRPAPPRRPGLCG